MCVCICMCVRTCACACTQWFIKGNYMLFISTRATLLHGHPSAYNKDVTSNILATLRSVQSRIAHIFCVMCY